MFRFYYNQFRNTQYSALFHGLSSSFGHEQAISLTLEENRT